MRLIVRDWSSCFLQSGQNSDPKAGGLGRLAPTTCSSPSIEPAASKRPGDATR
jgi:hypothetical protein